MTVEFRDNSDRVKRILAVAVDRSVGAMAVEAEGLVRRAFPTSNQPTELAFKVGSRLQFRGSPPGTPPGVRSNRLRGSIATRRAGSGLYIVGTNVHYARLHEFGGTIRGGGTAYVMIPPTKGARPEFVPLKRETAARRSAKGQWVGRTKPHTIRMPQRPYLRPTIQQNTARLEQVFAMTFQRQMAAAGGDA
jgi:phage gpG-like protein